jgi:hypothetical protein
MIKDAVYQYVKVNHSLGEEDPIADSKIDAVPIGLRVPVANRDPTYRIESGRNVLSECIPTGAVQFALIS